MPTITATAGAINANSYVTREEWDAYIAETYGAVVQGVNAEDKESALIRAARRMQELRWHGTKTANTQALAFPRSNLVDPDAAPSSVTYFSTSAIPTRVKRGQCELAYAYLQGFDENADASIASYSMDGFAVTRNKGAVVKPLPDQVMFFLHSLQQSTSRLRF